jgi:hypothetical protein
MGMPIMVGGDGSVIWKVRVKKARHSKSDSDFSDGPKDFRHQGVAESNSDELLKITLRLPEGVTWPPSDIGTFLKNEAATKDSRVYLTLWLPVEPGNGEPDDATLNKKDPDQIVIDWMKHP